MKFSKGKIVYREDLGQPKGSVASSGLPVSGLLILFLAQVLHEFSGMISLNAIRPGVDG